MPLARDTFDIEDLELSQDTVIGDDVVAVALDREEVAYAVADNLRFEDLKLNELAITFPTTVLEGPAGTAVDTTAAFDGLSAETRLVSIDSLRVDTGTLELSLSNRLVEPVAFTVVIGGFVNASGDTLVVTGTVPAASGDGSYATTTVIIDLQGVTISPGAARFRIDAGLVLSGSPLNPANATDALVHTGSMDLEALWLRGPLDPDETPELRVPISDFLEIPESSLDPLGDFRDILAEVALESAVARLRFVNPAGAPVELEDFTLGVVALTASGAVPVDPNTGGPAYEEDDQGNPLVIPVPAPGESLAIGRSADTTFVISFPALADRVLKLLLDGRRAAIVGTGDAVSGDGQPSYLQRTDTMALQMDVIVGVDVSIPPAGVEYPPGNQTNDGLGLEPEDAEDVIANLLVRAGLSATVVNETPYELEVTIAFIEGDRGTVDVSTLPGSVILAPVRVAAPAVDAQGRVLSPVVDTVESAVAADQIGPLLGEVYTATVKPRFFPGQGGGGRAALGVNDRALIASTITLEIKRGGGGR